MTKVDYANLRLGNWIYNAKTRIRDDKEDEHR